MFGATLAHPGKEYTRDISEPLHWCRIFMSSGILFIIFFNRFIWNKEAPFPAGLRTSRTGMVTKVASLWFLGVDNDCASAASWLWPHLSYTPSQEGSGWLQKWFFSQTSGSSWLSLYPGSHWNDTVDPMDRSVFDRAPLTGIPGSMQEYVSKVTTAKIQKYRERLFCFAQP